MGHTVLGIYYRFMQIIMANLSYHSESNSPRSVPGSCRLSLPRSDDHGPAYSGDTA